MLQQLRGPEGPRRRRSSQPVYATRRRKRIITAIVLGLIALILASWFGFRWFQRLRLEGETFRENLNRRLSTVLACQVELTRIHDGGDKSLTATEARIDVKGQDLIQSGTFSVVNASLTPPSWVSPDWGITMLTISEATINFDPARPVAPDITPAGVPVSAGSERRRDGYRFGITPEPDKISLDVIRFTRALNLEWPAMGADRKTETIRGLNGFAKLRGGIEGAFTSGTMALKSLPEIRVEHLDWKLTGRHLDIHGGHIAFGRDITAPGRVDVSGKADLVQNGSVDLKLTFEDLQLKSLLPAGWAERVFGSFKSKDASFKAAFGNGPERIFEGDFEITGAVLRGMMFLKKVATSLHESAQETLEFPRLTGHFKWSPSTGAEITLSAEKEKTVRLSGNVLVNSRGEITGRLKMEASEIALRARAGGGAHPFGALKNGWAPLEFQISGTAAAINDDIVLPGTSSGSPSPPAPPREHLSPSAPPPLSIPPKAASTAEEVEKQFNEFSRKK